VAYLRDRFKPPVEERPWILELSGRALSLAMDIDEMAKYAAAELSKTSRPFRFHDVAYGGVRQFRSQGNLDVFLERTALDSAHANLVILREPATMDYAPGATGKQSHQIYREIALRLETCAAEDLTPLESLRIAQPPN
jgi:hypothetical protein